jgi:hypothetical protein
MGDGVDRSESGLLYQAQRKAPASIGHGPRCHSHVARDTGGKSRTPGDANPMETARRPPLRLERAQSGVMHGALRDSWAYRGDIRRGPAWGTGGFRAALGDSTPTLQSPATGLERDADAARS